MCVSERASRVSSLAFLLTLSLLLAQNSSIADSTGIRFISVNKDDILGTGSLTHSRGKARYMFEMTFFVAFEIAVPVVLPTSAGSGTGENSWRNNVIAELDSNSSKKFKGKLKVHQSCERLYCIPRVNVSCVLN